MLLFSRHSLHSFPAYIIVSDKTVFPENIYTRGISEFVRNWCSSPTPQQSSTLIGHGYCLSDGGDDISSGNNLALEVPPSQVFLTTFTFEHSAAILACQPRPESAACMLPSHDSSPRRGQIGPPHRASQPARLGRTEICDRENTSAIHSDVGTPLSGSRLRQEITLFAGERPDDGP